MPPTPHASSRGCVGGQRLPEALLTLDWCADTLQTLLLQLSCRRASTSRVRTRRWPLPHRPGEFSGAEIAEIAEDEGINVEVRKFTVTEVVEASKNGSLKEMFGAGTAAVISPIAGYGFKGVDYDLPELENPMALKLKKRITDIQTNKTEDPFGWTVRV